MNDFAISSVSSIVACVLTYPIDVVKVRLQVDQRLANKQTINQIIRNIRPYSQFYNGVKFNLISYPIFWGTFFQIDNYAKNITISKYTYVDKLLHALAGSFVASIITNPFFVLRTRYQTGKTNTTMRSLYFNEGIYGLFKGLGSTLANNSKLGLQFPLYDYLRDKNYNVFWASFASKLITSSLFYPFDLVRTNQRDSIQKIRLLEGFKLIYKQNGFLGLYRGLGLYTLTTLPNFVIMMCLKEIMQKK